MLLFPAGVLEVDADILEPGTGSRMAKLKVDPWFLRVAGVFRF